METPPHDANALRRTTRSALVEIPTRLGSLRVTDTNAITPANDRHHNNNNNTNIAVYGEVLGRLSDTNINLPSSYISPSPSPDELVIIQRGRRRMPVSWSPDIDSRKRENNTLSRERTPVKQPSPSKSTIVLRSTPRKRLLLNDPTESTSSSPDKNKKLNSPNAKKCRIEKPGTTNGPLETSLKGLSHEQLITVIQNIITNHTELEQEVKDMLPKPDLHPLEEQLNYLKKNIFKSLPTSRLTSKTDSPAYSRAATHVLAFKKCVLDQARKLLDSQQWDSVLEYVILAWSYVRQTPLWDNPPHNAARRQCFKSLAAQCMFALKKAEMAPEICNDLYSKLEGFVVDSEEIQSCLKFLDSLRKKC